MIQERIIKIENLVDKKFNKELYKQYKNMIKRYDRESLAISYLKSQGYVHIKGQLWKRNIHRAFIVPLRKTIEIKQTFTIDYNADNGKGVERIISEQPIKSGIDGYIVSIEKNIDPLDTAYKPITEKFHGSKYHFNPKKHMRVVS